jgi:hypothetical protein
MIMRTFIRILLLLIFVAPLSTSYAKEYTLHAGAGAASGTRYGMPFTLGGSVTGGAIPQTILKPEFEAGLWYMNDSQSKTTIVGGDLNRESAVSWWTLYQGARINIDAVASMTGLMTQQGVGAAVVEAVPYQLIRDSKKTSHYRMGKTETSLMGHAYVRYDLNPGQPTGLFVEGDVWVKLTGRNSQESAAEIMLGKLGFRFPGF